MKNSSPGSAPFFMFNYTFIGIGNIILNILNEIYIHYVITFEENTLCIFGTSDTYDGLTQYTLQCRPLPWKLKILYFFIK